MLIKFQFLSKSPKAQNLVLITKFRADINLLDECLQLQKSGKHVYQKSSFFV